SQPAMWIRTFKDSLPQAARRVYRQARARRSYPAWITESFARRTNLAERIEKGSMPYKPDLSLAQQMMRAQVFSGWDARASEGNDRFAARLGRALRHPFCDRRLIEFAFALPGEWHRRGGLTKAVLRDSVRGLIPESIRLRPDKAHFTAHCVTALE